MRTSALGLPVASSKVYQSPIGDANSADRPAIGAIAAKSNKLQRAARVVEIMTRDSLVRPTPCSRPAKVRRSVATRVASAAVARGVLHAQNERGIRGVS